MTETYDYPAEEDPAEVVTDSPRYGDGLIVGHELLWELRPKNKKASAASPDTTA